MAKDYSIIDGLKKDANDKICTIFNKGYNQGYEDGKIQQLTSDDIHKVECEKSAYNQGLNDAWECARKIVGLGEPMDVVGAAGLRNFICKYSASEAIAKIKEYEEKKWRCDIVMIAKDMAQTMAEKLTNEQTAENFVEWFRTNIGGGEKQ